MTEAIKAGDRCQGYRKGRGEIGEYFTISPWPRQSMQDYRKLVVWKDAHALTIAVYRVTVQFPPSERFGLISQARRAAASVGANLAEGAGRTSAADFRRFVTIAAGSLNELDYWLLLARDLCYLSATEHHPLQRDVGRLKRRLSNLHRRLGEG